MQYELMLQAVDPVISSMAVKSILFVFGIMGSGYVKDAIFLGMELHLPRFFPRGQLV